MKINWINGWKAGNKKEKYEISLRLGIVTIFQIKACLFCKAGCKNKRFRFMILNLGFEV